MESLALFAGLIFLSVLFIGPITYILSCIKYVPQGIVVMFSVTSIAMGFWWIFLPLGIIGWMGLLPIVFGFWALDKRVKKKMEEDS
jgi:hypothetical protein